MGLMAGGLHLCEEVLVGVAEGLVVRLELILLRIGEVELLRQTGHSVVAEAAVAVSGAVRVAVRLSGGKGQRAAQREGGHCCNDLVRRFHLSLSFEKVLARYCLRLTLRSSSSAVCQSTGTTRG